MRVRRWLLAWVVVALSVVLPAPLLAACQLSQILEFKVTMSNMQPLVSAKINGTDVQFVADSGAFYSVISPGSAAELHLSLKPISNEFQIRGIGGSASASLATVKNLTLAGVPLNNIQFLVSGSEVGAIGLLGQNVLGLWDVEYDLEHGAIRLMKSKDCAGASFAYWPTNNISTLTITHHTLDEPHTIGTVLLNGKPIRAIFDTGAGGSILSLEAAARVGIKPNSAGVKPAGYSSGLGHRTVQTWIAPVASLKIGDEEVKNIHVTIGDLGLDDADMLIGADFFLSHRVYVSNSLHKMIFSYDGGPVFNTTPRHVVASDGTEQKLPDTDDAAPTDAEGFSRRGAAFASRRQYDRAIADFTRACDLAPTEAHYFYQRAMARLAVKQTFPALADLDQTLKLEPGNVDAHLTRAALRIEVPDTAEAREDIDAAEKLLAIPSDKRLEIGSLYAHADAFDKAVAQYDLWIKAHPDDSRRGEALNDRCWARAEAGRDLDKALSDCTSALHLHPHAAMILDSRGLVYLRTGAFDKAIADYDAALALSPRMAWSLYGRGIAERHKGLMPQGDADIAAATAIDRKLPDQAKALGVAP